MGVKKPTGIQVAVIAIILSFLAAGVCFSAATEESKTTPPDPDTIAVVNGRKISREAYKQDYADIQAQIEKQGMDPELAVQFRENILQDLILKELIAQEIEKQNIVIPDEMIQEGIERIKRKHGGEEGLRKALKENNTGMDQLRWKLRQSLSRELLIEKEIRSQITLSEEEVRNFYKEHKDEFTEKESCHARHIFIQVRETDNQATHAAVIQKLKDIRKKIEMGEDFAVMARKYSEGPNAERGGDLGFFPRGKMAPAFEEAAFGLEPGEISDIVKTRFGYHLIQVLEKKTDKAKNFDEVKGELSRQLYQEKVRKGVHDYYEKLKEEAEVTTYLE